MRWRWWAAASLALLLGCDGDVLAASKNGFRLDGALVPAAEIHRGGPPRDGIPALSRPALLRAEDAGYLSPGDRVLGVAIDGEARAYPVRILNWHEVVNDYVGGQGVVVTYCPLCGSGAVFSAEVDGRNLEFGVSGLLYNSDVLLYDRQSESLWSQIMRRAISGPMQGRELRLLPVSHTSWSAWLARHPDSRVLSNDTGYRRDYRRDPYADYARQRRLYFPVSQRAPDRYHPKERVLGVSVGSVHKAYPYSELHRHGETVFGDHIGDRAVTVRWAAASETVRIHDADGELLPAMEAYWFAWYTFHPDTEVFRAGAP